MNRSIQEIELQRLEELEKQAALHGPRTDPAILIEIQDLNSRHPEVRRARGNALERLWLNYDFLMNAVAGQLQRLTIIEQASERDTHLRRRRQIVLNIWLTVLTVLGLVDLIMLAILVAVVAR